MDNRTTKEAAMSELTYDSPKLTVLGRITDMTRAGKPGLNFDFPGSAEGQPESAASQLLY